jgi:hypothetical protein
MFVHILNDSKLSCIYCIEKTQIDTNKMHDQPADQGYILPKKNRGKKIKKDGFSFPGGELSIIESFSVSCLRKHSGGTKIAIFTCDGWVFISSLANNPYSTTMASSPFLYYSIAVMAHDFQGTSHELNTVKLFGKYFKNKNW